MPRTELTVNDFAPAGLLDMESLLEAADLANGMIFRNGTGGDVFLVVKNADASAKEITVVTPRKVAGQAVADMVVSIAAAKTALLGPFPQDAYNQGGSDTYKVYVDVDDDTSVTIGAFRLS